MTSYICEGCGITVHNFAQAKIPEHGFCLTCELLDKSHRHDLTEFWGIFEKMHPEPREHQKPQLTQEYLDHKPQPGPRWAERVGKYIKLVNAGFTPQEAAKAAAELLS